MVDVNGDEPRKLARIRADGGQAEALTAEIGELEGVHTTVAREVEAWSTLNIVINNAYSGGVHGDPVSVAEEVWDRAFGVGLKSMFRAAKYAVPHLQAAEGGKDGEQLICARVSVWRLATASMKRSSRQ